MAAKIAQLNYAKLLAADPALQAAIAAINAQTGQQQAALTAARQAELVRYGAVPETIPELAGGVAADITPSVRQSAQEATAAGLSTLGQLQQGYRNQQAGSVASLIGRNSLRSGDYRRLSRENLQGYQANLANAQTGVLGRLADLWGGYQQQQSDLASRAGQATSDALARVVGGIQAGAYGTTPSSTTSTTPKPPKRPASGIYVAPGRGRLPY